MPISGAVPAEAGAGPADAGAAAEPGVATEAALFTAALAEVAACWSSEDEHALRAQTSTAANIQFRRGMAAILGERNKDDAPIESAMQARRSWVGLHSRVLEEAMQ